MTEHYDFVIVGGGSAGSALANRLSADPGTSVLVLEAGRSDYPWDVFIHMPAALAFPIGSRFYDWKYESEPEPHMGGRRVYHARGKVLGGSSSINGMIFQRGNPMDYERWASDPGMETWDHAHCLPYFKRMENCLAAAPDDPFRGHDGPLVLERGPAEGAALRRLLRGRAAGRLPAHRRRERLPPGGLRQVRPQRAQRQAPLGRARVPAPGDEPPEPHGRDEGVRHEDPVRGRPRRGRGVRRGRGRTACGRGEVVLCGGAINSPQLLQLSGIGAASELGALGIDVVADLPGVGENLQDHLEVYIQHSATQPVTMAPYFAMKRRPLVGARVAAAQDRPRRHEPLRGRRLRARQRRGEVPEPDVPLPADRGPLRRDAARGRRRPRLPGARRPDVLRRSRHLQGRQQRPARRSRRCSSTTCRPRTTAASGSRRSA